MQRTTDNDDKEFAKVGQARNAIVEKHGKQKPTESVRNSMPCPCCEIGTLHYSISSYNRHIHGACDSKVCVSWME
jgi:hypothetical protein